MMLVFVDECWNSIYLLLLPPYPLGKNKVESTVTHMPPPRLFTMKPWCLFWVMKSLGVVR